MNLQIELSKDELQLIRLNEEIDYQSRLKPLAFHELLPMQELFKRDPVKFKCIFGGNRCLGGETEIYDPVLDQSIAVEDIKGEFHVLAWNGSRLVVSKASKPFKKDIGRLFEITLSSGESFVCSDTHQVLTPCGYKQVSEVNVGCELFHPLSNSGFYQLARVLSGQRSLKRVQYLLYHCFAFFRPCGEQPQSVLDSASSVPPSQAGAQDGKEYASCETDGQASILKYNRPCQLYDHLSTQDDQHPILVQFFDTLYHVSCKPLLSAWNRILIGFRSMSEFFHQLSIDGFVQLGKCFFSSSFETSFVVITSIVYKREDAKWDVTVAEHHNYYACGAIHHNSGKTECVADVVVDKAENNYDLKIWVTGETYQDSVAIQQNKIAKLATKEFIKYGRYDEINGYTNRKLQYNNRSLITFKSYDQKRESFQSDDIDIVWNDEEMPYDIYKEQRMRLIDRDGTMIISMTSLKGVTELIENIYEDAEVIKSQYAPLVDEVLPRIAEKNGVRFYFLWTTENPHINQARTIAEAKLMTKQEIKQRFYGIPLNLTGKIYISMNKLIHTTDIESMPEGKYTIYMVLDPHDRKPWAMVWIAVHSTGTAYVIDEYPNKSFIEMKYDDKTYKEYAKIIRDKEENIKDLFGAGVSKRILDPNFGNKTVQLAERQGGQANTTPKKMLSKLGLQFRDGIDALEAGHLAVREWLHYDTADSGEIIVQPKLMFCDNCPNTILGMLRYSRKEVTTPSGDEKDKVGPQEKWKDFPDCIRYAIMSKLRYIRPEQGEEKFRKVY